MRLFCSLKHTLPGIVAVALLVAGCFPGSNSKPADASAVESQSFKEFASRVESLSSGQRPSVIDSFLSNVSVPYITGDTAVFIHRGDFESVSVAGDMTNWDPNRAPMSRLAGTDLWFREMIFEPTARLDYKLVVNDTTWILDPRNGAEVPGGYGVNSELAMSAYEQPAELSGSDQAQGRIEAREFVNDNQKRVVKVYLPHEYSSDGDYGFVLFHDGDDYLNLGSAQEVLDHLIGAGRIEPVIAAFVTSPDRNEEYGFSRTDEYEDYVVNELMPWLRSEYQIARNPARTATTGVSLGGLISTQLCYRNPDVFGLCGPISPSYWVEDRRVLNEVLDGEHRDISFYIDWGTYEPSIAETGRVMKDSLIGKGYDVVWNEWYEGHSWGNWRAHLDNMLIAFFGVAPSDS